MRRLKLYISLALAVIAFACRTRATLVDSGVSVRTLWFRSRLYAYGDVAWCRVNARRVMKYSWFPKGFRYTHRTVCFQMRSGKFVLLDLDGLWQSVERLRECVPTHIQIHEDSSVSTYGVA